MSEHFTKLGETFQKNLLFFAEFIGVVVAIFLIAVLIEVVAGKVRGVKRKVFTTRMMAMVGMFSALATILYLFDFPLPFAPGFYKVDFSELPVMVGGFAFGPVAGVMIEFVKVILKIVLKGSSTAFVGDLANFAVGCALFLPASAIYEFVKSKRGALIGSVVGTLCMAAFGGVFNGLYLLPKFAELFHMEMDTLIAMGTAINAKITNVFTFVLLAVVPLNLVKGGVISLITLLIYKPLSPIIKEGFVGKQKHR